MVGLLGYLIPLVENDLKMPILVYGILISLMIVSSAYRKNYTSEASFRSVFIGAFLFLGSDSALALANFAGMGSMPVTLWTMASYHLAQWFIFRGICVHNEGQIGKKH